MMKITPSTSDKLKRFCISTFRYVIVFGIAFYIIYPLLLKSLYMFMDEQNIYDVTVVMIPKVFTMENIKLVMSEMNYLVSLINTLVFSAFIALLQTVFCCFAATGSSFSASGSAGFCFAARFFGCSTISFCMK